MSDKVGQVRWEVENLDGTVEVIANAVAAAPAADIATVANAVVGGVGEVSFVVGASDTGTVAIQLGDHNGDDLAEAAVVMAYLADTADGLTPASADPDGGVAIGTDGALMVGSVPVMWLISEADGDIDLVLTESGAATWYLVLVLPNGTLAVSGAIVFTA